MRKRNVVLIGVSGCLATVFAGTLFIRADAMSRYAALGSDIIIDRHGTEILVEPNQKGHFVVPTDTLPPDLETMLIEKEDRWFRFHPGVNPVSTVRALLATVSGDTQGGSTITQQLAKQLLGNELERSLRNKLRETVYAIGLELGFSKDTILSMYSNTVYFGNQVQGFETASRAYFERSLAETTISQQLSLLATISHPGSRNPWEDANTPYATVLAARLTDGHRFEPPLTSDTFRFTAPAAFELRSSGIVCDGRCVSTVDAAVTERIRDILRRGVERTAERGGRHAAAVVLDPRTGEVIALVGSPDPESQRAGFQINLALEPRPVGSTIKPLIYLRGFETGLRPYTLIEDREYRYPIATGYNLYPQNYDGQYRGEVTLHEALSSSLNVPTVKTLEHIGLDPFYRYLADDLGFQAIAPLESYEYGIALGGLETDLLTLSTLFTIFPTLGTLQPPHIMMSATSPDLPLRTTVRQPTTISEPPFVSLVNVILADRLRGVEQFGLVNNLTLPIENYGVKTGTSRDYHDSWVVGYTPDMVVGVWLGNAENEPLAQISGQTGAGALWNEIMSYLITTPYYSTTPLPTADIMEFTIDGSLEWGLPSDDIDAHRYRLQEDHLITSLHHGDEFSFLDSESIPLQATEAVEWSSNGTPLGFGTDISYAPPAPGRYEIMATTPDGRREIVLVTFSLPE
jgi:membrane peptidoglycan carboxypeptidase